MFNSTKILSAMKAFLDEQLPLNAPLRSVGNPKGWPHLEVTLDVYRTFSRVDFIPDEEKPLDTYAFIGISPGIDSPEGGETETDFNHSRTLNISFVIMAVGHPAQTYIEPIADLICVLLSEEGRKLSSGTGDFWPIIIDIGLPTISYEAVNGEADFSKGTIDIPVTYSANTKTIPTSYLA